MPSVTSAAPTSPAGTPATFGYFYLGPEMNVDANGPLVPTDVALRRVFDWFFANGGTDGETFFADVPGIATQIRESLDSPHVDELTAGVSRQLGNRGAVRADVVWRQYGDFYTRRTDTSTGIVTDPFDQRFDLTLIENSDLDTRDYIALNTQATLRPTSRIEMGVTYTLSRLRGTLVGENAGSGPLAGTRLQYPEYKDPAWNAPEGDLSPDQRHRLRLWGHVRLPMPERLGTLGAGVLQQIQSGTPYGAVGSVRTQPYVTDPGYLREPESVAYFYTARDAFRTAASYRTDLAIHYAKRLPALGRAELFAQGQVLNVFNGFQLFNASTINTSVRDATFNAQRYRAFNPFTERPVEGTHWEKGPLFGQAVGAAAYTLPRTATCSVGIRF